jgi:hypothetical protein
MTMRRLLVLMAAAAVLAIAPRPIFGHHSMAMYDSTHQITLSGTVTEFRLANPHMQLLFDVKSEQGTIEHWSSIGDNPVNLRRRGWNRNTIKPNDQITITGYPARDGRPLMTTEKLVVNGKELE